MNDDTDIHLMGVSVEHPHNEQMRFSALIWGPAGAGKTTLASTAPGDKLILCCDPDGEMSLTERDDVSVMRLYQHNPLSICGELKKPDPYNLTRFLTEHPRIETVVFDSMTMFANMALHE